MRKNPRPTLGFLIERIEPRWLLSASYTLNGVQPVAFDQPQINALFRLSPGGTPITATDPTTGDSGFNVQGFLDTGTSSLLLSQETAQGLGLPSETYQGKPVAFTDIGIGGGEQFDVSQPLYVSLANFSPAIDGTNLADFTNNFGPVRTEINQQPADPDIGALDIFGMPVLQGKVAVFDPTPINSLSNMNTYLYNPGTPFNAASATTNPGIPATDLHVKLSYGSFANFVLTTPTGAPGPTLSANPFIGPDPVSLLNGHNDGTPPVVISEGGFSGSGSFLLDTGAADFVYLHRHGLQVHVHYQAGTEGTANPVLVDDLGHVIPNQFSEPVGGIGGTATAAGFYLDSLTLPTTEGTPVVFTHAPVLVIDVTAQNPTTHQNLTLDGDFGMNYLVTSTDANLQTAHTGDFTWVTLDQPHGLLGLYLPAAKVVNTAVISGTVFNDLNAVGTLQTADPGLANWRVYLDTNNNGVFNPGEPSVLTDAKGHYSFSKLPPGTYYVRQVPQPGWRLTTPASVKLTLSVGAHAAANFGDTVKGLITGSVFNDKNANGKVDPGEALAGWRVYLQTAPGAAYVPGEPSVLTDKYGNWSFNNLAAGNYVVRVVQMTGYTLAAPATASYVLTLGAGGIVTNRVFLEKHQ